jgi:hypothetical protein
LFGHKVKLILYKTNVACSVISTGYDSRPAKPEPIWPTGRRNDAFRPRSEVRISVQTGFRNLPYGQGNAIVALDLLVTLDQKPRQGKRVRTGNVQSTI